MAILNLTPDSFSDGGALPTIDHALAAADQALAAGADILDLGGESTRPGAAPVPAPEQIRRTAPVISALRRSLGESFAITIDTTLAPVARAAFDSGADAVNDTSAGADDPALLPLCAVRDRGMVLMHRLRAPAADRYSTQYATPPDYSFQGGVVAAVRAFLSARANAAIAAGIEPSSIVLDPGLGFGKSVADNLALIDHTRDLASLGFPILSGLSRKSFVARAAGLPDDTPPRGRVQASIALSLTHLRAGAAIFRVHDVREHAAALREACAATHPS